MDARWGFVQNLFSVPFRATEDSGTECTAFRICYPLVTVERKDCQSSITVHPFVKFDRYF